MKQTKRVTAAAERAVEALAAAVTDPGAANSRAAAEAIVTLRRQFRHEGIPDWAGRSLEYRDVIERVYRQAGVPADSESGLQASLRYHVGNAVRQVAPPEDLTALGMIVAGPRVRMQAARANGATPRVRTVRPGVGDPAALAALALAAVRALATMEPGHEVEPALRKIMDESLEVLRSLPASAVSQ